MRDICSKIDGAKGEQRLRRLLCVIPECGKCAKFTQHLHDILLSCERCQQVMQKKTECQERSTSSVTGHSRTESEKNSAVSSRSGQNTSAGELYVANSEDKQKSIVNLNLQQSDSAMKPLKKSSNKTSDNNEFQKRHSKYGRVSSASESRELTQENISSMEEMLKSTTERLSTQITGVDRQYSTEESLSSSTSPSIILNYSSQVVNTGLVRNLSIIEPHSSSYEISRTASSRPLSSEINTKTTVNSEVKEIDSRSSIDETRIPGRMYRRCKEEEDYLQNYYRDPPPRKLPTVSRKRRNAKQENQKIGDSLREIKSNQIVWQQLHDMNLLKTRPYRSYLEFRNKQREILFNLPTLNESELRRGKTPASVHVTLELYEEGHYFASRFLYGLLDLQSRILQELPPYEFQMKPLSKLPNKVYFIGEILKEIECFMNSGEIDRLISVAFYTARHFEKQNERWWWLSNEFYKLAQTFSYGYDKDFGYSEALINYMYGRYQLLKDHDSKRALQSLLRAQELSNGKLWEADWVTGVNSERLSVYSTYLCHIALLMEAEHVSVENPKKAAIYAEKATEILKQGDWHPDLEEASMDQAIYKTKCKKYKEAIIILENLEKSLEKGNNKNMYLCVEVLLALCYQRGKRPDEALSQLLYASELAKQWNQPWLLAIVHKYLGEYFMNLGKPVTARKYLASAIIINNREQNYKELVRNLYLYGYSKGFQFGKEYMDLLISAGEPDSEQFQKLLHFLSNGKPFWDFQEEKRYVIVPKKRPSLKHKKKLNAAEKVYLLLKNKLGNEFADHAMDEIKKFANSSEFERSIYLHEDPIARKYFKKLSEAEECQKYLKRKYKRKNDKMKQEFGEYILFDIEERFIESESVEDAFRDRLNCINPIIPYKNGSWHYKQALETIDSYLNPKPKPNKIYIPYPGPRKAGRLLNTLPETDKIQFCSEEPINVSDIAKEMALLKMKQEQFLFNYKNTLKNRYENNINQLPTSKYKCPTDHNM